MDTGDAQGGEKGSGDDEMKEPEWMVKKREYEERMARVKNAKLRTLCTICSAKAKLPCPCGTTQYCSVACQKVDWRERGHKKVCKEIRARAEAPTPPPSPPRDVVYGPAPRSHADEIRARIAAEHEAARARREANPEREPESVRFGGRCPICLDEWDVNKSNALMICCCRRICASCDLKIGNKECPLCRMSWPKSDQEQLARLRRHVENDVPEAINVLARSYRDGDLGLVQSYKKAVKIYKRAVELGNAQATIELGHMYEKGRGVTLDLKKAKQLYRMAADRGNANAQFNVACALVGEGHIEEAASFYRLAADQKFTAAEHTLGVLYVRGEGVERNYYEARRWFARAADGTDHRASSAAMCDLGNLYRLGYGVERDIQEGRRWYERAAAMGDKGAIATLEMLDNPPQLMF